MINNPEVARWFILGLYEPSRLSDLEAIQFSMMVRFAWECQMFSDEHLNGNAEPAVYFFLNLPPAAANVRGRLPNVERRIAILCDFLPMKKI